jgi:hypothetical protein
MHRPHVPLDMAQQRLHCFCSNRCPVSSINSEACAIEMQPKTSDKTAIWDRMHVRERQLIVLKKVHSFVRLHKPEALPFSLKFTTHFTREASFCVNGDGKQRSVGISHATKC